MPFYLEMGYDPSEYSLTKDNEIDLLARDGECTASGIGFGFRDRQYRFETEEAAAAAQERIEAAGYEILRDVEEEEDE